MSHKITVMRITIALIILILAFSAVKAGDSQTYSIGVGYGYSTLLGGTPPWFTLTRTYHIRFESYFREKWRLELGFSSYRIYDDSTAHSQFKFGSEKIHRTRVWKGTDLTTLIRYRRSLIGQKLFLVGGVGGGIAIWKMADAKKDTTLKVVGQRGETVDFSATEVMLSSALGLEGHLSGRWKLAVEIRANYLTGAGAEFAKSFDNSRGRWSLMPVVFFSYRFGKDYWKLEPWTSSPLSWESLDTLQRVAASNKIETTKGQSRERGLPAIASDSEKEEGCSGFKTTARGLVDLNGCPIDTDCDGIPDYADNCPNNPMGAMVDKNGCPIDSDKDGIPDGLDDCPGSDSGMAVDKYGCIDLSILEKPIALNVRYQKGSFEIDPVSQKKLDDMSRILRRAEGVRVEIDGYAFDAATIEEDLTLSQKRANRVRDYLLKLGIDTNRMKPVGKGRLYLGAGEGNVQELKTAPRIELIFFK
ncbi:MAG: OmpA family protein [candidate division Zixibacteria bacterium]|nr:OmpA family protein [candidate division Zixibacteria bacterium]